MPPVLKTEKSEKKEVVNPPVKKVKTHSDDLRDHLPNDSPVVRKLIQKNWWVGYFD